VWISHGFVSRSKHCAGALTLLAAMTLGLVTAGSGHCQPPKKRKVELQIRGEKDHYWLVDQGGTGFVAELFRNGDERAPKNNFEPSAGRMWVSGRCMAYDPQGRSKDVLARETGDGGDTQWQTEQAETGLGVCLRVPQGPLKGWWVGLGPAKPAKADPPSRPARARAPLVLVPDRKDAAVFRWADPYDEGK
jgi:hypothetical protein